MQKSDVIKLLSDKKYLIVCRKIAKGNSLYKDLYQESILALLEYPDSFFETLRCPECFFIKIVERSWNSKTSRFYYKYCKQQHTSLEYDIAEETYDTDSDQKTEQQCMHIKQQLDQQYWYDRIIWDMYQIEGSTRKVGRRLGIPFRSIANTIKKVKQSIYENTIISK